MSDLDNSSLVLIVEDITHNFMLLLQLHFLLKTIVGLLLIKLKLISVRALNIFGHFFVF